ncbi:hypothetical protein [Paraburkholderia tropica]|uniref:hypothetical protein n=1 Tax=Paraburkholderia tropica TaxID=92647 RepID=UPI001F328BC9|nr:hypothetical protein [Paraburkholderia tropica]
MQQRVTLGITQWELDEVHEIAKRLTTRRLPEREKSSLEKWVEQKSKSLFNHSIAIFIALFVLVVISAFRGNESLRVTAIVAAVLIGMIVIAAWFIGIGGAVPFFNRIRKEPYSPMFWAIRAGTEADIADLESLMACRKEVVELYLLQYKHERESFERRGAMIAGALDKIGLFPAMAAFVGIASSIWSHSEMFLRVLVFVVPAFYLMTFATWQIIQEMNRAIAVLEYAVKLHGERAE